MIGMLLKRYFCRDLFFISFDMMHKVDGFKRREKAMVIRCPVCKKIKKFGKWIEVPKSLEEEIKKVPVLFVHCESCGKGTSAVTKPPNTPKDRVVCF